MFMVINTNDMIPNQKAYFVSKRWSSRNPNRKARRTRRARRMESTRDQHAPHCTEGALLMASIGD